MKTINISDELHTRLKTAADFCGISLQNLVTEMIERDFKNSLTIREFIIEDVKNLEYYHEQMNNYIRFKNLQEGDFKVTLTSEVFQNPVIRIYHK